MMMSVIIVNDVESNIGEDLHNNILNVDDAIDNADSDDAVGHADYDNVDDAVSGDFILYLFFVLFLS